MSKDNTVKGRRGRKKKAPSEPESEVNLDISRIFDMEGPSEKDLEQNTISPTVGDYNLPRHGSISQRTINSPPLGISLQEEIKRAIDLELEEEVRKMKVEMQKMQIEHRNFNEWFTAIDTKIDCTKSQLREEIEDSEIRLREEVRNQLKNMHTTTESRLTIIGERLDNTYTRAINTNEKVVQLSKEKIKNLGSRQTILEDRVQNLEKIQATGSSPTPVLVNKVNPMRFNTKTPLFSDGISLMKFIEELKSFWTMIRPTNDEIPFILSNSVKGPARDWWDLVREQDDGLEEFCDKFKRRYWGDIVQHSIRAKLEFGHYISSEESTMVDYALDLYREAKYLSPPPSNTETIRKLSRHFSEEIRSCILSRSVSNLQDFIDILETFDKTGPINSKRKDTWENKNPTENWRNKKLDQDKAYTQRKETKPTENWRSGDRPKPYPMRNPRNIHAIDVEEEKIQEEPNKNESEN